jgi:putative nucleotidyltransferase with HDIG domain
MRILANARNRTALRAGLGVLAAGTAAAAWALGRQAAAGEARQLHRALVDLLLNALSAGDAATAEHCRRVADLTYELARRLKMPREACATLRLAALLHDLGKIDDEYFDIVHSREKLTEAQRRTINSHPCRSAHILEPLEAVHPGIKRIVSSHHECWNGGGYPEGLRGEQIPLEARVISVADVFDALTQWRTYRDPVPAAEAFAEIRRDRGTKFDPGVVDLLDDERLRARWTEIVREGHRTAQRRTDADALNARNAR